jgi:transcription termination factor NusA
MSNELIRVRGIGPAAATRLVKAGVDTIEQLASAKPEELAFVKGIGVDSAKKIIKNAQEIIKLEKSLEHVLDAIRENFVKSCPKCGGAMESKYIIVGPERRMNSYQCKLCKFYLPG